MNTCTDTPARTGSAARRDRGQVAIEYLGFLPLLLLVALLAIQLGLAAYAANQAGTGARAGARMASKSSPGDCARAGKDAMSGWTAGRADLTETGSFSEVTCTASIEVPSVVPGIDNFGHAVRSATMRRE
ncbi:TadE/TadG family type IV pilus assembly protein [Streptomyces sp. NPDC058231]|uniref:TadE/TadG family type IV pilus assembly protein n=1 Tax=Streptomyces sp. NPDC058231 TaxID=3346392 RepID=UPI0036EE7969